MKNETLGVRLRFARRSKDWTQQDLSDRSKVKQSTISKIERGAQESSTVVPKLAEALGVRALWLSEGEGEMLLPDNSDTFDSASSTAEDAMLYQYADPRCVHGPNANNSTASELTTVSVSRGTLARIGINEDIAVGYIQIDDSMGATLTIHDEGIINMSQRNVRDWNGKLFAIHVGNGSVVVRRLLARTLGGIQVSCDSADKSRYPDEILTPAEAETLPIIGRLCWSSGIR